MNAVKTDKRFFEAGQPETVQPARRKDAADPDAQPSVDSRVFLAVAALLAAALAVLPLLRDRQAADLVLQVYVVVLVLLAGVDLITRRVPNLLVYPAIVFSLAAPAVIDRSLVDNAALGGGVCLVAMFVLAVLGRGAMGMGDVKLAGLIGCILGLKAAFLALLFGFGAGAIVALVVLVLGLRGRKDFIPLTPFLAASAVVWLILADWPRVLVV